MEAILSRSNKLKRQRILALLFLVLCFRFWVPSVHATTIDIDLSPSPNITSSVGASFVTLNGIALQHQTLSLDFTFVDGKFVRLFSATSDSFVSLLRLETNGSGVVGFLKGTGFLVDQQGNRLGQREQLGSASGDNGLLAAGLFPLFSGELQRPLDFFGIHFQLKLPMNSSISITGAELVLKSEIDGKFGVGPGVPSDVVPDLDNTFLLLSLGSLGPVLLRQRRVRGRAKRELFLPLASGI